MTNLREKIAQAIDPIYFDHYPKELKPTLMSLAAADAVIEALNMHEERGRLKVTRYVTDWYINA